LCLALAPTSCLNPATDDQPSERDAVAPGNDVPGAFDPGKAPNPGSQSTPTGGAAAAGAGELDGLIDSAPEDSTSQADAGPPAADAGPDAQPPVVGQ
jgi:hypothetical protein